MTQLAPDPQFESSWDKACNCDRNLHIRFLETRRWSKLLINNQTLGMVINLMNIPLLVSSLLGCHEERWCFRSWGSQDWSHTLCEPGSRNALKDVTFDSGRQNEPAVFFMRRPRPKLSRLRLDEIVSWPTKTLLTLGIGRWMSSGWAMLEGMWVCLKIVYP